MNIKTAILFTFSLLISSISKSDQLENSDISAVRLISTEHSVTGAQRYVMVKTSKLNGCTKGLFFKLDENPEIYSSLLAVKVSGHNTVNIDFNNSSFEPWSTNNDYCALTAFEIIY